MKMNNMQNKCVGAGNIHPDSKDTFCEKCNNQTTNEWEKFKAFIKPFPNRDYTQDTADEILRMAEKALSTEIEKAYERGKRENLIAIDKKMAEEVYKGSEFNKLLEKAKKETLKACGGCKNCYGKGYSTTLEFADGGSPDFPSDHDGTNERYKLPEIRFCTCERGKELKKRFQEAKKEERERIKNIIENDMDYVGVLESNEKRRGYDIARQEIVAKLNKDNG